MTMVRCLMALAQTFVTALAWHTFQLSLELERDYTPAQLAAVGYRGNHIGFAIMGTVLTAAMWALAILAVVRDERRRAEQ